MGRWRSGSGSGARGCAGLALLLILAVLTGGAGGVLDAEARLDGVARVPVPSDGTRRQLLRSRALAQVDDVPSAFTTWGLLGAFASVGETVSFEIHARARDGTLLESFDDPSAFTVAFDGAPGAVLQSPSVERVGGGVFRASFVPAVAGELTVTLRCWARLFKRRCRAQPGDGDGANPPTDPGRISSFEGASLRGGRSREVQQRTLGLGQRLRR